MKDWPRRDNKQPPEPKMARLIKMWPQCTEVKPVTVSQDSNFGEVL